VVGKGRAAESGGVARRLKEFSGSLLVRRGYRGRAFLLHEEGSAALDQQLNPDQFQDATGIAEVMP
jgi:hypothetical protein